MMSLKILLTFFTYFLANKIWMITSGRNIVHKYISSMVCNKHKQNKIEVDLDR